MQNEGWSMELGMEYRSIEGNLLVTLNECTVISKKLERDNIR